MVNQGKRISQVLFIIVLCVFILYMGVHMNIGLSDDMEMYLNSFFCIAQKKLTFPVFPISQREEVRCRNNG